MHHLRGGRKIINFSIMARTVQGSSVLPNIKPIVIDNSLFSKVVSEQEIKPIEEKAEEIVQDESNEDVEEIVETVEEEEGANWIKTSAIVIAINIVLIIAIVFLFKFTKKKRLDKQAQLLDRLA